jgi:RecG-like helicase
VPARDGGRGRLAVAQPPRRRRGHVDGFELSRVDLEHRREGDVLGADQSGRRSSLRLLRLLEHEDVIADARAEAAALVEQGPPARRAPGAASGRRRPARRRAGRLPREGLTAGS